MPIRELPDYLINQIAAGEVVERPANVVKELVENALDAGADQIVIDVADGGRTLVSVMDNGGGMSREDLGNCIKRHATSKLPGDDLLGISFMGFRGEALPSIASVGDMTIDTRERNDEHNAENAGDAKFASSGSGFQLDCSTGEIRPSPWEEGTRVRVENLFAKTPARLKFLRSDRVELMYVAEIVKRLAMARPDVGFVLNDKWRFPKGQPLIERVAAVMGGEVAGRMIEVDAGFSSALRLRGFISEPTLRRASAVDQYLFVNGRPVKDKVLVGALRAAYMDVMHAREFPLCALYLELPQREVDVNVSPAKTEVHFLEPARIRGFIIKTLRDALARTMLAQSQGEKKEAKGLDFPNRFDTDFWAVRDRAGQSLRLKSNACEMDIDEGEDGSGSFLAFENSFPLGKVVGQIGNKYILAELPNALAIVDQHAAAERITYERLRKHELKRQPLLFPIVAQLKPEQVDAILEISEELHDCGITAERFGEDAISIQEKPADWELDWDALLRAVADEVFAHGHSAQFQEKLHLKLANHACHHSVRAGQRLSMESMDALLRDIEKTEHGGECNHGRPVYKIIPLTELDGWFER